jgi:hypothetical protein
MRNVLFLLALSFLSNNCFGQESDWFVPFNNFRPGEHIYQYQTARTNHYMVPCEFSNDPSFKEIVKGRFNGKIEVIVDGKFQTFYRGPNSTRFNFVRCKLTDLLEFEVRHWYYLEDKKKRYVGYTYHVKNLQDRLEIIRYLAPPK